MNWDDKARTLLVELDDRGMAAERDALKSMILDVQAGKRYSDDDAARVRATARTFLESDDTAAADFGIFMHDTVHMAPRSFAKAHSGRTESGLRGGAQGLSIGFSDEIEGAARGVADVSGLGWLGDQLAIAGDSVINGRKSGIETARRVNSARDERRARQGADGGGIGAAIGDRVEQSRGANEVAQRSNPWTYGAAEVGSGALTGITGITRSTGKAAFKELTKETADAAAVAAAKRASGREAIKTGAGIGAAAGAGYADVDVEDQFTLDGAFDLFSNAATGAVIGGGLNRAAQPVFGAIGKGASGVKNAVQEFRDPQRRAAARMRQALEADGMTPSQADDAMREMRDRGADFVSIADVSPSARSVGAAAVRAQGAGRRELEQELTGRQRGQEDRILDKLESFFGGQKILDSLEASTDQAKRSTSSMYDAAYAQPLKMTDDMQKVFDSPNGQKAMNKISDLVENAKSLGDPAPNDMSVFGPGHVHYAIRALRSMGSDRDLGIEVQRQARRQATILSKELKKQNPQFSAAQKIYSDQFGLETARELGDDMWRIGAREASERWKQLNATEQMHARAAFANKVRGVLENKRQITNQALDFDKTALRKKLALMFDEPMSVDEFLKTVADEDEFAKTFNRLLRGSDTFENQANSLLARDGSNIDATMGYIAGSAMAGPPGGIAGWVGGHAMNRLDRRKGIEASQEVVDMLMSDDPLAAMLNGLRADSNVLSPFGRRAAAGSTGVAVEQSPTQRRTYP